MSEIAGDLDGLMELAALHNEPLHPDLVPYMHDGDSNRFPILSHPLVHELFPVSGMVNRAYLHKKERLFEATANEDWHTVVFLHERPYRCEALIDYVLGRYDDGSVIPLDRNASQEVRDLVTDVWTDSENIHQHVEDWLTITSDWESGDPLLLGSEEERAEFDRLPETLTLWRGDCDDGGWSWSLDRKVGEFFAKRWSANHALLTGTVNKRDVFGFITRRNEAEVMVRREHVMNIETTVVSGNEED